MPGVSVPPAGFFHNTCTAEGPRGSGSHSRGRAELNDKISKGGSQSDRDSRRAIDRLDRGLIASLKGLLIAHPDLVRIAPYHPATCWVGGQSCRANWMSCPGDNGGTEIDR